MNTTPISLEAAQERVRMVDVALSEVGYGGLVYVAEESLRARGASYVFSPAIMDVSTAIKASMLTTFTTDGPETTVPCTTCAVAGRQDVWSLCPRYPVGALLSGASQGCGQ